MSLFAFFLIILSACMHATWNYLAKRSDSGSTFVWLYLAVSTIIYAPIIMVFFFYQHINLGWMEGLFIIGSAILHLAYSVTLQKGYKVGDLSVIYPIARGTGPLLVAIFAIFLFNERLNWVGVIGVALIVVSVFILSGGFQVIRKANSLLPIGYGLLIGVMIAGYTLLDKGAVSVVYVQPLLLEYASIVAQFLLLSPVAKKHWSQVKADWRQHRKEAIGVGILNPLAYILILTTMMFTPVSHVAPVREVSILIGAIMGTYLLREGFGIRRVIASGMMVIGIIALTFSG
ncbi:EamA family transporter [Lentibacillus sp. L22]|uniref:EamA family transporter n=1 Tax=Lentibacillus TaxID=175304 RepID=UPI0022B102CD|nr:EamA family transporter [Lentibacillus daqui]